MKGMLYLLFIPRECTPSDADPEDQKVTFDLALPFMYMPTKQLLQVAEADFVEMTKGICFVQNCEHGSLCK